MCNFKTYIDASTKTYLQTCFSNHYQFTNISLYTVKLSISSILLLHPCNQFLYKNDTTIAIDLNKRFCCQIVEF